MQYCMLLWPHANARYQNEMFRLARAELTLALQSALCELEFLPEDPKMPPSLLFRLPRALTEAEIAGLSRQSLLYGLFQSGPDGSLLPLCGREVPKIGADLPGILKYKGKTNELFTELLIHFAELSCELPEKPRFFDPMCGRGTGLFVAANRGWDAFGADIDRKAIQEGCQFLRRYLEYHRFKHQVDRKSLTLARRESAPATEFRFANQSLCFLEMDAARAREAFSRAKFDLISADLPYGVQHSGLRLEAVLSRALPAWREVLRPGGAISLSFNAQTLPRDRVRALLAAAGWRVCSGGPYDQLAHWVEQAVTRDVAVAIHPI